MDFTTRRLPPATREALRQNQIADRDRECPSVSVAAQAPRQYPAVIVAAIREKNIAEANAYVAPKTRKASKARGNRQGFRCGCEDFPCCGHGPLANDY